MQDANTDATLRLDVVSDAICPWCWIGKRQLGRALALLAPEGLAFAVHWRPFQLNPDMPKEGRDRRVYRTQKFGSLERGAQLDAQVAQAGEAVGLSFRHDLMARTPNTVDAHRVIRLAGERGVQDAVVEALFRAYFADGQDIGDAGVLTERAAAAGLDRAEIARMLAGEDGIADVVAEDHAARSAGVNGVPSFFLNGYALFSGALPAETIADGLRRAVAFLREQQAA
jgi:predicted DsbA family dithiol-disulfide isomerase